MSKEWRVLQEEYLSANKIVDQALSGKQWVSGIIATVRKQWIEVWEDRNGEVHGRDATTREMAKKEQAANAGSSRNLSLQGTRVRRRPFIIQEQRRCPLGQVLPLFCDY
jgi:hypothetical protein